MRTLLFLDIDGVLAHDSSGGAIDPECVDRLNEIIGRTGAEVVISSTWRTTHGPAEMQRVLERRGFAGRVAGATPVLLGKTRGEEIASYIAALGEDVRFAILDDVDDMGELADRLVTTDELVGLQKADVEQAVELLGPGCGPTDRRGARSE